MLKMKSLFQQQIQSLTFKEFGYIGATVTIENKDTCIEVIHELEDEEVPRVSYQLKREEWDSFVHELVQVHKIFIRRNKWFDEREHDVIDDSSYELKIKGNGISKTFSGSTTSRGVGLMRHLLRKHFSFDLFSYRIEYQDCTHNRENLNEHLNGALSSNERKKITEQVLCAVCGESYDPILVDSDGFCMYCWLKAKKAIDQAFHARVKAVRKVNNLYFDDCKNSCAIHRSFTNRKVYFYNQIADFELLEDGESVGAVVGDVLGKRKTKRVCKSLQIKITLRSSPCQTEYISLISTATKKSSDVYKSAYKSAQDMLSALQMAVDRVNQKATQASAPNPELVPTPDLAASSATEILKYILKYKELLNAGTITEEEFQAKKAQILSQMV